MGIGANAELLLRDALERTVANPTSSRRWHGLLACYEGATDTRTRCLVRQRLLAHVDDGGIPGFLRATFLAGVTDEAAHIAEAGRLALEIEPVDPDRLMAFAAFEWGRALGSDGDRDSFLEKLKHARLHEIMERTGAMLGGGDFPSRDIGDVRKVALVASFVGGADHSPTELALDHARLLLGLGMAVHLFSCQELMIPDMAEYLGNMGRVTTAPPDRAALAARLPRDLPVTLADERVSLMRRWHDMRGAIASFDPDMVLFIGLNSPLVAPLYAARPVLGLCVHSLPPMAPVDVWLTANHALADRESETWHPALPPAWGHHHGFRIHARPVVESVVGSVDRSAFASASDDIVLVTAGARLDREIGGDWAARMAALLDGESRLVWMLVGGVGLLPPALAAVPPERLRLIPHRPDLRAVLRCCDVYVNPPRLGGGFSVAEAMAEGLPVVAFARSDGGSKLGEHAVADDAAYFSSLRALIDNAALRAEIGTALRARFAATLDLAASGPSLRAACDLTVARFHRRIGR